MTAKRPNSVELWRGQSEFDGQPIVVLTSGLRGDSTNAKTGAMTQVWIMRSDIEPHLAVRSGDDVSICGTCPFRSGNGCYVLVQNAPLSLYRSWKRGNVPVGTIDDVIAAGLPVRWGAYGDMGAVPEAVAQPWMESVRTAKLLWTGYTHAWRSTPWLAEWSMASVSTKSEHQQAFSTGWRTFAAVSRAKDLDAISKRDSLLACPSLLGAQCATCGLCRGAQTPLKRTQGIIIAMHGAKASRAEMQVAA